jgi:hypothetical protein
MTFLRTIAAVSLPTVLFATAPITEAPSSGQDTGSGVVSTADIAPILPLPELPDTDIIEGVRIVAESSQDTDGVDVAVQAFAFHFLAGRR